MQLPPPYSPEDVTRNTEKLLQHSKQAGDALHSFAMFLEKNQSGNALLAAIFGNSPYLSRLLIQHFDFFERLCVEGVDARHAVLLQELSQKKCATENELMNMLRLAKNHMALLTAVADITGLWPLETVTHHLSQFAESCLRCSCAFLLKAAADKGEITLAHGEEPEKDSGLIVLGMGKLGAGELNYSSDIDLIIFFDREKIKYHGKHDVQRFFNKLAQDLVRIMQERTSLGYVFRTDLRLRPDPASTPPAISVNGAYFYYESVGQNWERAAMIKARPVAGDIEAGEEFLKNLTPYIWRKHLDFAAITDIHSIKRQMDTRTGGKINLRGHNIKLGAGGIREIEFYAQIHQLIWGGRIDALRLRPTCETLQTLVEAELIPGDTAGTLIESYRFLRHVEHRLQMMEDQQTHSLPATEEGLRHLAMFCNYAKPAEWEKQLTDTLKTVHSIYADSFKSEEQLSSDGNLVFTGVEHDPETLRTIAAMGYKNSATISEIIQGWHHGRRRATRTKRARELITELTPALLKAFSETGNPDGAFLKFDEFLAALPAGVQLFSLFHANPHLLGLISTIMGSAPALAEHLSKNPNLLDTVLYSAFYAPLPSKPVLEEELAHLLRSARDYEEQMIALRQFKNEKQFQAGVQLLKNTISAAQAGDQLSLLAEVILQQTFRCAEEEYNKKYPSVKQGRFAILALGKLGARELTFGSDIDLVFVYAAPPDETMAASTYYNRLSQRIISALTSLSKGGELYEVDTRLRPSGKDGPLAVNLQAFDKYFLESAWTFEYMALTKGRVVAGDKTLAAQLENIIRSHLCAPRDMAKAAEDALDIREKVAKEFGSQNPWDIKYARGGLMDVDFIAQFLLLKFAPDHPEILAASTYHILENLKQKGLLEQKIAGELIEAQQFLSALLSFLRLCNHGTLEENSVPAGLEKILANSFAVADLNRLKEELVQTENRVYDYFKALIQ